MSSKVVKTIKSKGEKVKKSKVVKTTKSKVKTKKATGPKKGKSKLAKKPTSKKIYQLNWSSALEGEEILGYYKSLDDAYTELAKYARFYDREFYDYMLKLIDVDPMTDLLFGQTILELEHDHGWTYRYNISTIEDYDEVKKITDQITKTKKATKIKVVKTKKATKSKKVVTVKSKNGNIMTSHGMKIYDDDDDNIDRSEWTCYFSIDDQCMETYPCQHKVFINGKVTTMDSDEICKLFIHNKWNVPKHFI
jgi:hypothetical protein